MRGTIRKQEGGAGGPVQFVSFSGGAGPPPRSLHLSLSREMEDEEKQLRAPRPLERSN